MKRTTTSWIRHKDEKTLDKILGKYVTDPEAYKDPPVTKGYRHVYGEWFSGFVIERKSDGSSFTWIPVGYLEKSGVLDTLVLPQAFGRRNFREETFGQGCYYEPFTEELKQQYISINRYGGFYISTYNISQNPETLKPQSVRGEKPWTKIDFSDARWVAIRFEPNGALLSHLPYGAEYDSILEWLLESGAKTHDEIAKDSSSWGNYLNTNNTPNTLAKTGSNEDWCVNNIYDLAGNVNEWTQEKKYNNEAVIRGGSYYDFGNNVPVATRGTSIKNIGFGTTGFRIALCVR